MTTPTLTCSINPAALRERSTELLVLGPSLGTTTALWDPVISALRRSGRLSHVRILRFDLPGHGASPATGSPFSLADLADAVVRLVDETGGGRFHYAGVSLAGSLGIELALRHPERMLSLGLFCTDAKIGTAEGWAERANTVRTQGTAALVDGSSSRWFADGFVARDPASASRALTELRDVDGESYALCVEALARFDRRDDLAGVSVQTIAVSGEEDTVTTPADLEALARAIPGATSHRIDGASHLAPLERPEVAAGMLADLVAGAGAPGQVADVREATLSEADTRAGRHRIGMSVRREVLGDAHVDAAVARTTAETEGFQDFITRYAWGEIWARPQLERQERSIATLASLVTGGHENEIAMHVRAALRNGLSREQISEVILHTALYAGLPAANAAFAIVREVFAEESPGS
ncbi:3-oxoadipate enol-lactonase [Okibacterium endophyticum]